MARRKKKDERMFWAGDCETDPFKHGRIPKPFIWGLDTGTSYHEFATAREFAEFVRDNEVIVFFHNGGKFDMHFLLEYINLNEPVTVINGRLVVAKIGKAEIRDSWNIIPVPLASFGGKLEIDYAKLEREKRDKHMSEIREYLREDCRQLYLAIDAFERDYGRYLTMASASLGQWKKISGLPAPKSNKAFFEKFSKYYYGGRVQCFQTGHIKGPLKVVDIRSAYPWAMCFEHPYEPEYVHTVRPKNIRPQSMVTLRCISMGALPFRDEKGSIIFPDDNVRREYHVPGHEILAALETNSLREVEYVECYDFTNLISFKPYIDHFFDKRLQAIEENDIARTIFCKLFMNSLYGKFCANPENYGNYMCVPFGEMSNYTDEGYVFDGMIGPHALLKAPLDPWQENYLNVATGASITSQVRAKLWRAIKGCQEPVYCDTDSLTCRETPDDDDFVIGKALGNWSFEGTAHDAWIAGKKLYYMEGDFDKGAKSKSASKGVNLKASVIRDLATGKQIKGGEAIKLAALGNAVEFANDAPTFSVSKTPRFQTRKIRATA